jgi:SagB-type dehydrogenase family enzyme
LGRERILMGQPPDLRPALGEQDPALEPLPYKRYLSLQPIPLPHDGFSSSLPALDAIAATGDLPAEQAVPDLTAHARICLRSNGLLKRWRAPNGREIEFRAAGCTGARYHLELYVVCGQLPASPGRSGQALEAGLYHYAPEDHSLRLLRAGDYRRIVVDATGDEPAVARAPVIVIITSTFWRNAWRYQERTYRHVYWDAGTVLANLLAVTADQHLPARVVLGFADREINALLDIDGRREAAVCLVAVGRSSETAASAPPLAPLNLPTQPLSPREIEFPAIAAMHEASSLASGDAARAWRTRPLPRALPPAWGPLTPLQPIEAACLPSDGIDEVIARRRSNRHYAANLPLAFDAFSTVLDRAARPAEMDCLDPAQSSLHDRYLIVNNVESLVPGLYVLRPDQRAVELLSAGDYRSAAMRVACNQEYAAAAHVNAYALTDLTPVLAHFGNRGYRVAQLEAALFGARLQLAAHALGLGAVGSTSIDDEVTALFSPHAAGKSFMFVAVFGIKRRASAAEIADTSRFLQPEAEQ